MKFQAAVRFASFFAVNLAASLHAAVSYTVAENAGQATVLGGNRGGGGEGENGEQAAMNPSREELLFALALTKSALATCPPPKRQRTGALQNLADSSVAP